MRHLILPLLILAGCARTVVVESPAGARFPEVSAARLSGEALKLPDDLRGKPALLLIGYSMKAQFDLDRWALGAMQAGIPVQMIELPTIQGLVPSLISERIDQGMRSGIPKLDWPSVATVYADAEKIAQAIGNENPQNAHVVLIDSSGVIAWRHNTGYSPRVLLDLKKTAAKVR